MDFFTELGVLGLFVSSFLAATILPMGSEVILVALLLSEVNPVILVVVATIGNVLGSLVNYGIGFLGGTFLQRRVLKVSEAEFEKLEQRFRKLGVWSLLFAWVPIVGDPLTLIAGGLRINILLFLLLVTLGKFGRYLAVAYVTLPNGF
ncbi:probable membrane protein YPO3302 [hydrothermal vent metagenome]|uniref:Probable membrane protein YPO3302 n=1 Tax=hydrothermal vent metagenome TaxID=652676 RepID=A0A3B0VWC4_9ZZZZ